MSGARIRRAGLDDVPGMLALKAALPVPDDGDVASQGGFLLGSTPEQYALFVERAHTFVLAAPPDRVRGFAIAMPDALVRASDLWTRRSEIRWVDAGFGDVVHAGLTGGRVGYIEQLAVAPGQRWRRYAPILAWAALAALLSEGHDHVFATTLRAPVLNPAALPLLLATGAKWAGRIDETYPGIGRVVSDVYHLDRTAPPAEGDPLDSPLARRLARSLASLAEAPASDFPATASGRTARAPRPSPERPGRPAPRSGQRSPPPRL